MTYNVYHIVQHHPMNQEDYATQMLVCRIDARGDKEAMRKGCLELRRRGFRLYKWETGFDSYCIGSCKIERYGE